MGAMGWIVTYVAEAATLSVTIVMWAPTEQEARKLFEQYSAPYAGGPVEYKNVRLANVVVEQ